MNGTALPQHSPSRLRDETGTMTVLTIGVLVVILMVVGVGVAITGVYLERNELQEMADGAALAASQAFDESSVYAGALAGDNPRTSGVNDLGLGGTPRITEATARRVASDYLRDYPLDSERLSEVRVAGVTVDDDGTVHVTLAARGDPPLVGWFTRHTGTSILLQATGDARAQ